MGRRKIEIKAIKDDRNRSVTFLKRKGGLFKKAHELSVLCSVDVAVFVFGNNKKLYEYSSVDMRDMIARYQYHGGPNEHKGPNDFDGGEDDDDEDGDVSPPRGHEGMEPHMVPPHYHQQQPQAQFPQLRNHTASPPVTNGMPYQSHPAHPRGHTPQPQVGSRPASRNDMARMGPNMAPPPPGPPGHHGGHPGVAYMPTPPIYNPPGHPQQQHQHQQQQQQPQHTAPSHGQYYAHPQHHAQQHPQQQPYADDRRPPPSGGYVPQSQAPPAAGLPHPHNAPSSQLPPPPPPQGDRRPHNGQGLPPVDVKMEAAERPPPPPPMLKTDSAIKKLSQRKSHSIFTPIEENKSILSQHLDSFAAESSYKPGESARSQSVDVGRTTRAGSGSSPPARPHGSLDTGRASAAPAVPETTFTPPSRSNSAKMGSIGGASRPRLTVQIPDGASEASGSANADSSSPRNPAITPTNAPRHNSVVLPPPSPSASALLSAGATGPPNPFARPPPQQPVTVETPASALPSRFLNNELLPSPSSFYPEWNFRGNDSNTLPSPLNFATPVVGSGPSFLRDEHHTPSTATSAGTLPSTTTTAGASSGVMSTTSGNAGTSVGSSVKRKSDTETLDDSPDSAMTEPKRTKLE